MVRVMLRHTHICSSDADVADDALQQYDNKFDFLGPIVSGHEMWNGHRRNGGGSILLI